MTDFEKRKAIYYNGLEKIDSRPNVEKGLSFKSIDGKEWELYKSAMAYKEELYKIMLSIIDITTLKLDIFKDIELPEGMTKSEIRNKCEKVFFTLKRKE